MLCLLVWAQASALGLLAQTARWEPSGGTLPVGKLEEIALIFEGCSPKDEPKPPQTPGLTLVMRGRGQNISIVNFRQTRTLTYSFAARLERKESVEIPAFEVETDEGTVRVPAVRFDPGEAKIGQGSLSIEDVAQSSFSLPSQTVWVGEVFPVTYRLDVLRRYYHQLGGHLEWDPKPLVIEEWAKPEGTESQKRGEPQYTITYRSHGYAKEPGQVTFNPAQQLVNIQTGTFGGFFGTQPRLEQIVITSNQPRLTVRPLPLPAPTSFNGAVGQFKFSSKIVPAKARVGEPITWTLELSGVGNWPEIPGMPERSVSRSFEVVQPQAKRTMADGRLFEGTLTEDVVLMPTKPGSYVIGPVSFSYFDPKAGTYRTVQSEKVTVVVEETEATATRGAGAGSFPSSGATEGIKPATPSLPHAVPGDTRSEAPRGAVPLSQNALISFILLPLAAAFGFWLFLACKRALAEDAGRSRRAARRRLLQRLPRLATLSEAHELRPELLLWQRDTAALLGLANAAPTALEVEKAGGKDGGALAALWRQADPVIYGPDGKLPGDWHSRAAELLAKTTAPAFPWHRSLFPRNLLPWWFALLAFVLSATPGRLDAAEPKDPALEAYSNGEFSRAAALLRETLSKDGLDVRTRHNLGLALLQEGRNGEAVSHLAAAFVQAPWDARLRRDFSTAMRHAGVAPQTIGALVEDHPGATLARLASPRRWQLCLALASLLLALAIAAALWGCYSPESRKLRLFALIPALLSLVLATASLASLHSYGPAVQSTAALVWQDSVLRSVPTEADSTQKTSALQAGTLAIVEHEFLGWSRLRFPDGNTGWTRTEDLVPLWR